MNKLTLTAVGAVALALSGMMVSQPAAAHDDAVVIGTVIGLAGGYYLGKHSGHGHHHGHHRHGRHAHRGHGFHRYGNRGYRGHGHHRGHKHRGHWRHR